VSDNDRGRREGKDREKAATERGWRKVIVEGEGEESKKKYNSLGLVIF
jgi:hypothetical protein